ncbi:hypothetical protein [Lentilactobacillus farraginis]|uniref:Uncharacterized protein n=1 Tax=Lentilactobacillus farraginis DSM 18382 = JCM 14108 TaxID=1423743 RepID=X0PBB1_9LACO|nr:hypothetical protein [Lentilactobacillus farraginis]KRM11950.1 hypothetical protein FD41_GL001125 [Lentilactobacillus farraginis DSM 18382 = JCM 14108]GAF37289.1 hypothetical protein JCM14108_2312 [Lentilactobacillus farraginis DSM 18382 = JCM 14108]
MGIIHNSKLVWGIARNGKKLKGLARNGKRIFPLDIRSTDTATHNIDELNGNGNGNLWLDSTVVDGSVYILTTDKNGNLCVSKIIDNKTLEAPVISFTGPTTSYLPSGQIETDHAGNIILAIAGIVAKFDLAKVDTNKVVWGKQYPDSDFVPNRIAIDSENGIVVVGTGSNIFAYYYDKDGNYKAQMGLSSAIGEAVAIDADDNIYIGMDLYTGGASQDGIIKYSPKLATRSEWSFTLTSMPTAMIICNGFGYVSTQGSGVGGSLFRFTLDSENGQLDKNYPAPNKARCLDMFFDRGGFIHFLWCNSTDNQTNIQKCDWDGASVWVSETVNAKGARANMDSKGIIYVIPPYTINGDTTQDVTALSVGKDVSGVPSVK